MPGESDILGNHIAEPIYFYSHLIELRTSLTKLVYMFCMKVAPCISAYRITRSIPLVQTYLFSGKQVEELDPLALERLLDESK